MLCQAKLPPSGRDFEVFSAVILGGQTTRQAALQFKLSQTRICQIVERLRAWQAEVLPSDSPLCEERLLRMAKYVAAGRLDHLYGEMMEAWRKSQGQVKKTRCARFGDEVTTTTTSCGDPKYLQAAMRLAMAQAELGAWGGLSCPEMYEDGEEVGQSSTLSYEDEMRVRPEARPTDHLAGDCSTKRDSQPAAAPAAAERAVATAGSDSHCSKLTLRQALARRQLFAPVQTAGGAGDKVGQSSALSYGLGLSVDEILTQQQRRARKQSRRAG